ncbi:MraY family glycosyltransferase [Marispirochaeta aestuarii]|uniref:MraY family glycosyltransferase n=1 Tax=Marispirochaeta aestuarii TaxID=1963862 RepID=UPI0029C66700|nr:MraY family glycosyltransferase [Marispirochaeta aestuarii]
MHVLLTAPLMAFLISLASMPLIMKLSHRMGWYDDQDHRKIHTGEISRLGGLGFFSAYILTILVFTFVLERQFPLPDNWGFRFILVIIAGLLIFLFGVVDDLRNLHARNKIVIQLIAAFLVLAADFTFKRIAIPFFPDSLKFGLFRYPLTLIWIIGIINAVNMIDGSDGLAGGITSIAAISFGILFLTKENYQAAMGSFILAGAVWGFLVFNLPPAKLFMGDGGSQFLGFMVAVLPLIDQGSDHGESISLAHAMIILAIPISDTIAAVWRRLRDKKSVFSPDRSHLHHKLLNLGFSSRSLLAIIYSLQIALCVIAVPLTSHSQEVGVFLFLSAGLIVTLFFTVIHYTHKHVQKNKIRREEEE